MQTEMLITTSWKHKHKFKLTVILTVFLSMGTKRNIEWGEFQGEKLRREWEAGCQLSTTTSYIGINQSGAYKQQRPNRVLDYLKVSSSSSPLCASLAPVAVKRLVIFNGIVLELRWNENGKVCVWTHLRIINGKSEKLGCADSHTWARVNTTRSKWRDQNMDGLLV